jgi:hypothetical protein
MGEKVEVYFHIAAYLLQNRNEKRVILDFEKNTQTRAHT